MELDPSLAYTALREMWPGYDQMVLMDTHKLTAELARAMSESDPPDRWSFARRWIDAHASADPTPRYMITWTYRGPAPDLVGDGRYTWRQVEHELSFDDGERTTVWAVDPKVRACTCSVPPDGNPDHASVTDRRCPCHGPDSRCPGESGQHEWVCLVPEQGPDAHYGCKHCVATAWGRDIGLASVCDLCPDEPRHLVRECVRYPEGRPAAAAPKAGSGCRHCAGGA